MGKEKLNSMKMRRKLKPRQYRLRFVPGVGIKILKKRLLWERCYLRVREWFLKCDACGGNMGKCSCGVWDFLDGQSK